MSEAAGQDTRLIHGSTVCLGERGVLVRGPAGSGKSALALALIARWEARGAHAALVADDQTVLRAARGALIAACPPTIRGLVECRGLGIAKVPFVPACRLSCVAELSAFCEISRLPEPHESVTLCGVALPLVRVPREDLLAACRILQCAIALGGHWRGARVGETPDPPQAL